MSLEVVDPPQQEPCKKCGSTTWGMATVDRAVCNQCSPSEIEFALDSHPNAQRYKLGAATETKPEPGTVPDPDTMDIYLLEREPTELLYGLVCPVRYARKAKEMVEMLDSLLERKGQSVVGVATHAEAMMAKWEELKKEIEGDLPGLESLRERMRQTDVQSKLWVPGSPPTA